MPASSRCSQLLPDAHICFPMRTAASRCAQLLPDACPHQRPRLVLCCATAPRPASLPQRRLSAVAPQRRPCQQRPAQWRPQASSSSATTAPLSTTPPWRPGQQIHYGAPCQRLLQGASASNKPHPAEKSTPVWLAIWHIWAGFANSQQRCATSCSTY